MSLLICLALLAVTLLASWYNAVTCGKHWTEAKIMGGFPRVLMWCAATQSAIGFSMLLILLVGGGAQALGYLPPKAAHAAMSLWYLLVIVPAIGTGLVLTIHSWAVAWRERNWQNIGTAAWNTYASASNIYDAANGGVLDAILDVGNLLDSDDEAASVAIKLVLFVVAIAILGGVLITAALIRRHDRIAHREAALAYSRGQAFN